jgi:hypothetical protein
MNDSPKADDARDDFILQERLSGRSARSISKELHCTTADVDASLDRTLPKITNEAKRRIIALDLDRLDELVKVFFARAIEKVDAQAGLLVVKILERKAALLGLDSPQKLDVVQVQAQDAPSGHERIKAAIMSMVEREQPVRRAAIRRLDQLGPEKALELLGPLETNGGGDGTEPWDALPDDPKPN